ncbi:MAG: c-type cytochrome, partial [Saprospiraceae bacterium]|nr:c-type cytochrome [Saprospiraceae bacterium]
LRGEISRDPQMVVAKIRPLVGSFLNSGDPEIIVAAANLLHQLNMREFNDQLDAIYQNKANGQIRSAILRNLSGLEYAGLVDLIEQGMGDQNQEVRETALGMLDKLDISVEDLPKIARPILEKGSIREQQQLVTVLGTMPQEKTQSIFEEILERWERGSISPEVKLDIAEAIDSSKVAPLIQKLESLRSKSTLMDEYAETMYGGSRREGWRIFNQHATAQCTRCHTLESGDHELSTVGPPLSNVGNILSRKQILQAIIEPSARISPGYGVVMLTLVDDEVLTGTLLEEKENELVIKANNPEPIRVQIDRIAKRENLPSSMPAVVSFLSKREIRDLVEFLANLKSEEL